MSDRLDRDTAERMLRGDDTGPAELAELLASASAAALRDDVRGEETAVTAFRAARSGFRVPVPNSRRLLRPRLLAIKAALIGLALMLAGGVAIAASPHLPGAHGGRHSPAARTPATSRSAEKRLTAPAPSHPPAKRHAGHGHEDRLGQPHHSKRPFPGKGREGHPSQGKSHSGLGHPTGPRVEAPPLPKVPVQATDGRPEPSLTSPSGATTPRL